MLAMYKNEEPATDLPWRIRRRNLNFSQGHVKISDILAIHIYLYCVTTPGVLGHPHHHHDYPPPPPSSPHLNRHISSTCCSPCRSAPSSRSRSRYSYSTPSSVCKGTKSTHTLINHNYKIINHSSRIQINIKTKLPQYSLGFGMCQYVRLEVRRLGKLLVAPVERTHVRPIARMNPHVGSIIKKDEKNNKNTIKITRKIFNRSSLTI